MNTNPFKKSFTKNASQQTLGKFDQNATQRTKEYVLPLVVVMAVLLAFSSPALADYSGDKPMTIYEHGTIKGGLIFVTDETGAYYTRLYSDPDPAYGMPGSMTQEIAIEIPDGATVKMARLYNTYCWSTSNDNDPYVPGLPAQAKLTFSDGIDTWTKICDHECPGLDEWAEIETVPNPIYCGDDCVHYWDTKGQGYEPSGATAWDYPSGEFAWDVTGMVTGSGSYTATIENIEDMMGYTPSESERFVTFGFGLLIVYEHPDSPEIEYWLAEGCDILMARDFEPENAISSTTFGGVSGAVDANLTTVLTCSQGGLLDPPENMIYFNGEEIGPSTAEGDMHYGVNLFDVTSLFSSDENVVEFQDSDDCEYVHNAFLVVEYEDEAPLLDMEDEDPPLDTTSPAGITNLLSLNGTTWINWTWTDPPDSDFNCTMVYLNGTWKANTSNPFYTATNLAPDTLYEIGTRTVDEVGNINGTWISGTAKTLPLPEDATPPASVTNLSSLNGTTWINWTWANPPPDSDFNYTVVCLNGTWKTNTSNPFYTATNLVPDTLYEIGTRTTVDEVGNINGTWINGTAKTLPLPEDTTPPQGNPGAGCPSETKYYGTINGGIYFEQQGWVQFGSMTKTFNDVPDGIRFARVYTGVWADSPGKGGDFNITINGHTSPTYHACDPCPQATGCEPYQPLRCDTVNTSECHDYVTGCNVHFISYNATPYIVPGSNTVTVRTIGNQSCPRGKWDGRIYLTALLVVYEDASMPEITYWINEGAPYMEKGSMCDGPGDHLDISFYFNGTHISNPYKVKYWTLGFPHVSNSSTMTLNGNDIGQPDHVESYGGYDVFYRWDNISTSYLDPGSNFFYYYDPEPCYERVYSAVFLVSKPTSPKRIPGFEAVFAIAGILAVAYMVLRRKK